MDRIRQILLMLDRRLSERKISRELKISRKTVRRYREAFEPTGLNYKSLLNLSDVELDKMVGKSSTENPVLDPRKIRFLDQATYFLEELKNPRLVGVTRYLLWEEYCKGDPDPYGYSRFCDLLSDAGRVNGATMHFEHTAGEKLEVDFAGKPLWYVDKETGEVINCPVLVAVLPYSGYGYVEVLPNAKLPQLIKALNNCLAYLGGSPMTAKSDNTRQWVSKGCKYEPTFPQALKQWASHNKIGLLAARPFRPNDKPTAENHVYTAYLRIYAKLRNNTYTSLNELNKAVREKLDEHHRMSFQKKALSRREVFESQERQALLPLPEKPFELKDYVSAKVQQNYHILLGENRHYYSVPFKLIGKQVNLVYCSDHVEVFLNFERVALHSRNMKKSGYSTLLEHMPATHKHYCRQQE
ncbi:IS21 family transposase [Belliella sp. DSM 111904]|uniref:IS21 family transposase n=1 Tax=Belliella filtrata TaxID=2923435 RepID=A0ABS9V4M8_9BACT|nr:IS21 family transposase [Belliella filtrata]MCH7411362.1 IS21 family transposase [Belliella filtrata]